MIFLYTCIGIQIGEDKQEILLEVVYKKIDNNN